jgi:hypothetical protein
MVSDSSAPKRRVPSLPQSPTRKADFDLGRPQADCCEGAYDGVCGFHVLPVLGPDVVESKQAAPVLGQTFDRLVILAAVCLDGEVEGLLGMQR